MNNYYLGAFGNKSFIKPQYEIMDDGKLRDVGDNRWSEFPNGGTVSLAFSYDSDVDEIKNRLLKFKIDFSKDLHAGYSLYSDNSNKFQISTTNIEDFDREEIIEILDIECTIEDFLNEKIKRTIRIKHKPNKLILLRYGQDCYGPFEFMISDIEDSYGDETFYTLKIFVNSGTINQYKYADLEEIVLDGNFSIRRSDHMKFIYAYSQLLSINPTGQIEYFDNEELADFFKSLLDKSEEIENVADIREQFLQVVDSFSEDVKYSDVRITRICELLQTSVELSGYKVRIIEEYFKNNPDSATDKVEYLRTHEELLTAIAKEDINYDEKINELSADIESLKTDKEAILENIELEKQKLSDQQAELERLGEKALTEKRQEIEELQNKLDEVNAAIEKAKRDCKQSEIDRDFWKKQCDSLREECSTITKDINSKVYEWAANNRNSEIIRLLISQLEMPEDTNEVIPGKIENLKDDLSAGAIVDALCKKMAEAGRVVTKDEAYNYLISVVQNYITVFAGEPGTGKTSFCKLLAKTLGLYDERFAEILVERGWTSSKDLVGYYNPLTKEIEQTQPKFSGCMKQLDIENKNDIVEAPYIVLLDEANLSPIEFYWSHFNYYCDDPSKQEVSYANGEKYKFGDELKFLATINYDQTTTDLSPRFLDRAWVISMNPVSLDAITSNLLDDAHVANNGDVISLSSLKRVFGWENIKETKINQVTKNRLDRIVDKMKEGGHTISPRSIHSIIHYYLVAEKYMSSKEVALDYAVSQKILPCISGNGKKYSEFLSNLMGICKENQLNKSANIIAKILERSVHDFYGFFSL